MQHERVIAAQHDSAAESERRIRDLEARVAELTARNATLLQLTESFHGAFAAYAKNRGVLDQLMNSKGDAGNPVPVNAAIPSVASIPVPVAVAAEGNRSAVEGDAGSAPAAPPSAPQLPAETTSRHVILGTRLAAHPPLPGAASSGVQGVPVAVDTPPASGIGPFSQRPAAPPAHQGVLTLSVRPALVYHYSAFPGTSEAAGAPPKMVSFAAPDTGGNRKRAQLLLAASTCPVCRVEYADAEELRQHACAQKRMYQCRARADGCREMFRSASGRRGHEKRVHGSQANADSSR
ncbi:insulinoma-associated protein 1-like [Paramacrobiotus metropolitanus]|uniref:insulinoma-associated protein 1-like n=1 Tax=Paramacrobiotus metropolitanus TaxID=2943436 RepID=UPI002445728B|nr:insulinoma-associated protein 1-like [Paramacrobiotus metropolitanus]XP_055344487.1 insulinoma-associated protein 1-like [Paramacrobiotus metropolitanus]